MRECCVVLKERIIPAIPEGHPLRAELQAIIDDILIELPEDGRIWRKALLVIGKELPKDESKHEQWHRDIIRIWREETGTMSKKGFIVAVDGIDGSGKTTMVDLIHDYLYERYGSRVLVIRNPGATVLGAEIRKLVKSVKEDLKIDPVAERFLFCADNIQTLKDIVIPAMDNGGIVVADRWSFITDWAYGVPGGLDPYVLQRIQELAPQVKPDLYIVLRCSLETAKGRMAVRNKASLGSVQNRCRIEERGEAYMQAVCNQYENDSSETLNRARSMAKKVVIVDANEGLQEAKARVIEAIDRTMTVG